MNYTDAELEDILDQINTILGNKKALKEVTDTVLANARDAVYSIMTELFGEGVITERVMSKNKLKQVLVQAKVQVKQLKRSLLEQESFDDGNMTVETDDSVIIAE